MQALVELNLLLLKRPRFAEPKATRKITVMIQASNNGESGESLNILAIWTEIPPSIRIYLRAAPPPITNNSIAIDLTESANRYCNFRIFLTLHPTHSN